MKTKIIILLILPILLTSCFIKKNEYKKEVNNHWINIETMDWWGKWVPKNQTWNR